MPPARSYHEATIVPNTIGTVPCERLPKPEFDILSVPVDELMVYLCRAVQGEEIVQLS